MCERGAISLRRGLPEDFAVDALALEADRRAKALGRRYSYGQLIADITSAERQKIVEAYRKSKCEMGSKTRRRGKK